MMLPAYDCEDIEESRWSVDFSETKPLLASTDQPAQYEKRTKRKIWTNVAALVIAAGIFTMGIHPIDDLQSSLNDTEGLGVSSLGIKYGTMILGNLLTNTFLIRKLGSKWALVGGASVYCSYIVANFYPTWATLVPLTILAGLGGALMWTTLSNYLARLAMHYAQVIGVREDGMQAMFFSLRGLACYASSALGGLASSLILRVGIDILEDKPIHSYLRCGPNYCNEDLDDVPLMSGVNATVVQNHGLDSFAIYGLCSLCLAVSLFAVVIFCTLVDPLPALGITELKDEDSSSCGHFLATVRLWKNPKLLLLVPLSIVFGFQDAFWRVEFNKAYVTCSMGIQYIGFLMMCYNITALVSSFVCGWLGTKNRRQITFLVLALCDISALVCILFWNPTPDDLLIAFIVTGVTGMTYGGLSTLLLAYYGVVFPKNLEAAYSNLFFWTFLGSTMMYAWSYNLCLKIKLLIVLVLAILGIFGYAMTEILMASEERAKLKAKAKAYQEIISKRMLVPAGF